MPFWRVYVAEEIGSYKPDLRNFEFLVEHAKLDSEEEEGGEGVRKGEICMVAQSLFHDHRPAKRMGLSSAWVSWVPNILCCSRSVGEGKLTDTLQINRSGAGMGGVADELHEKGEVGYAWRVGTLGEFADLVEEAFEKEGK